MKAPPRFIARQLAHPRGLVGRFVSNVMNRHNAAVNRSVVRTRAVEAGHRVLDVGFGGDVAVAPLPARGAIVTGVDRSTAMVRSAKRRLASEVDPRRASFRCGNVEATLPFEAACFDRASTVNTVYFWRPLRAGFAEVRRTLVPRGRLAVGFVSKAQMDARAFPVDIFTSRSSHDVAVALREVGFVDVRIETPEDDVWCVVSAVNRSDHA